MTHEEIRNTLSGLMRQVFDRRLEELQELKKRLGDFQPSDSDEIPEVDEAFIFCYFEGSITDEGLEEIEAAISQSKRFLYELIQYGYERAEKLTKCSLKF